MIEEKQTKNGCFAHHWWMWDQFFYKNPHVMYTVLNVKLTANVSHFCTFLIRPKKKTNQIISSRKICTIHTHKTELLNQKPLPLPFRSNYRFYSFLKFEASSILKYNPRFVIFDIYSLMDSFELKKNSSQLLFLYFFFFFLLVWTKIKTQQKKYNSTTKEIKLLKHEK